MGGGLPTLHMVILGGAANCLGDKIGRDGSAQGAQDNARGGPAMGGVCHESRDLGQQVSMPSSPKAGAKRLGSSKLMAALQRKGFTRHQSSRARRKKTKNESLGRVGSLRKGHDGLVAQLFLESRFVLYDFRHSFATRMVQAGCDLPTLSALLGHTKIQMTMRYVHPAQEQKRSAMDKLERLNQLELVRLVERDKSLLSRYAAGGGKESHQKSHHLIKGGKGRAA